MREAEFASLTKTINPCAGSVKIGPSGRTPEWPSTAVTIHGAKHL